jgi:hypothetical protein
LSKVEHRFQQVIHNNSGELANSMNEYVSGGYYVVKTIPRPSGVSEVPAGYAAHAVELLRYRLNQLKKVLRQPSEPAEEIGNLRVLAAKLPVSPRLTQDLAEKPPNL